ncbi:MAG: kinase/pyrophosphorylase [Anaerolineae bacterium]|nr:kinase/pyrophosphorylase [Anaerolineae bacterium]
MESTPKHQVFVVSDATGGTAARVVSAGLMQFEAQVEVVRFSEVLSSEQIRAIVREAAATQALIVHTLVEADLRQVMFDEGRRLYVQTLDLMGPLLDRLSDMLAVVPLARPGFYAQEEYDRRIDAIDFAFRHDDGKHVDELEHAEIVLVGISRTGKTPLSVYLAYRGWMAGNVPIIAGIALPEALLRLSPERVIGLVGDPERLALLRRVRADYLKQAVGQYAEPDFVREEMAYAHDVCRRAGWRCIDMTFKPIEEAAAEVVALVGEREYPLTK